MPPPNFFDQFDPPQQALPPGFEVDPAPALVGKLAPRSGNYFDRFDPVAPQPMSGDLPSGFEVVAPQSALTQQLSGLPKQVGAGVLESLVAVPGAVPQTIKGAGSAISNLTGLPEPQPILNAPPTPEAQLSAALPAPQSEAEGIARNVSQTIPQAFLSKGHLAENVVGGIGAGLGAHYAPQIAPTFGMTPAEGAITGAVLGGLTGAHLTGIGANYITRGAMPKPEEVIAATRDAYDSLRIANRSIVVPPEQMRLIKNSTLQMLRAAGPSEEQAKAVYSAIDALNGGEGGTVADLLNARTNLMSELHSIRPDANKPAALMALTVINKAIGTLAPNTTDTLKVLDNNWSAARTAQAVTGKVEQAEAGAGAVNSGLNAGNKILQSINSYIKSRTDQFGKVHMNPADLAALQKVKPTVGENIERFFGIGGMGGVTLAGLAGGLGAQGINQMGANATEKADPLIGGIALPLAGLAARGLFNRSISRAARNAEAEILSRAPYMQGVAVPRALLSTPQVAARSLLFAAPAIRDSLAPSDAQ